MSIEDTIPMRLRRAYLTMHRAAQSHFSEFGVTVDQYVLLSVLKDDDGVTQTEVCKQMASDANTIAAMLKLLECKKLIRRQKCELDGRARRVYLTGAGRRLQNKLVRSSQPLRESIDDMIAAAERKSLFSTLDRVTDAMLEKLDTRRNAG